MESPAASGAAALKTLLVSDLVGSTRLVETLGDAPAMEVFAQHDRLARDLLEEHEGLEVDKTDGFLLLFERPLAAVLYALAYHRSLARLSGELRVELAARVGVHLGEVFLRYNSPEDVARGAKPLEVEGLAKPLTARLMSVARPRQTLLTQGAFDLARRAAVGTELAGEQLSWLAHGSYRLKGVDEPVDIFETGVEGVAPFVAPGDSEKVHRAAEGEAVLGWRPARGLEIPQRPHWVIESKLGEGGFGEVWLAAHHKTHDRRVFKFCFDTERLRGLQREITLFRLLKETLGERDDITRILDWSFEEPPYFIESEHVGGGSLLEWAEGGLAQAPLATRLEIVAQVAEALAAAHSVGVLHKAVKPANILLRIDKQGRPKVMLTDFGFGLVTDNKRLVQAEITALGMNDVIDSMRKSSSTGTRLYMAPELVEGKAATVQADVYAVGVMLYQIVAGDFSRSLAPGWERDVDDELLREDIALFVDGSPRRRLSNARRITERLRSLDERREARRAEQREKRQAERATAELERGRKRRQLLLAVVAVCAIFAGAMAVQTLRVAAEAQRANREAERASREAERAGREAEAARQVSELMVDLFEVADPGEARGNTVTAREILDRGAEQIGTELADQPLTRARLMDTIGRVYDNLGLHQQAAPLLEGALEIRRQHLGDEDLVVATSVEHLGSHYRIQERYGDAEPLYRWTLAIREKALGPDHPAVAASLKDLARVLRAAGRPGEAAELESRAAAIEVGNG